MKTMMLETIKLGRKLNPLVNPRTLLQDVSFQIGMGEVLAIVGPTGAGKSTLLRMLNRLDEPTEGQVLLGGKDYRAIHPRELRRRMGMVMQRPYLFPGTAAMNVAYGPAQHGIAISDARIGELMEQVGMNGHVCAEVTTLSGGEAQRVSIARALANDPEVLLLDEPTSTLDEIAKQEIEALLSRLVRERNGTCVWVTHDVAQAARVAGVVLRIETGRAVAMGTPREILRA